jgi:O-antigen ligase
LREPLGIPNLGINGAIFSLYPALAICLILVMKPLKAFSTRWQKFAWVVLMSIVWRMITFECRAGWLAGLVMIIVVFATYRSFRPKFVLALASIFVLSSFIYWDVIGENVAKTKSAVVAFFDSETTEPITGEDRARLIARDAGIRMFREHPILGWGPNIYVSIKPQFSVGPESMVSDDSIKGAFDSWLVVLAEMGLFGLLAVGAIFLTPIFISWNRLRIEARGLSHLGFAYSLGLVGIALHLFFIDLLYSFAWTHLAIALSAARLNSELKHSSQPEFSAANTNRSKIVTLKC